MRARARKYTEIKIRNRVENRLYQCSMAFLEVCDEGGILDAEVAEVRAQLREAHQSAQAFFESRHRREIGG